jgi:hypothetical protein
MVAGSGFETVATCGNRGGATWVARWAASPPQLGGHGGGFTTWTVTVVDAFAGATPKSST